MKSDLVARKVTRCIKRGRLKRGKTYTALTGADATLRFQPLRHNTKILQRGDLFLRIRLALYLRDFPLLT